MADAIIQARMSSSRLPGKVLKKINGITNLECLMRQLSFSKLLDRKILATTVEKEDDAIYDMAVSQKWQVFRGQKDDVLDRFYQCAKKFDIKIIVRITADNPLIDPYMVDRVVESFENAGVDYVSNCQVRSFPYGTEVEVFSFDALEKAWNETQTPHEREHVTPFLIDNTQLFKQHCIKHENDLSHMRWTVDTENDFELVRQIYKRLKKDPPFLWEDIVEIFKKEPELLEINKTGS
ncbi:MAG: glycosyltransferase family protein [Nitrosarchaeum sp.]|nr:glycosyltransferase family protein [Nitrosarchaeum sp.]MCA9819703.1 glycosyltransferase family protein [Nitrosarchaeum sp.]